MWEWTFDPIELLPLGVAAALYLRRVATLRQRGAAPRAWRSLCFCAGMGVVTVALASPIDSLGEERSFAMHMVQHLLLGDIAPLLCVAGLTGPILRPALALPAIGRLRALGHPGIAFPVWALDLGLWHLPVAYQAAIHNVVVHALEHACFFAGGAVLWASVLEPLPGPEWFGAGAKALYVLGVRVFDTLLAFVFVWSSTVFYPYYEHTHRFWGMSPIEDQNLGGIAMLGEGGIVTISAFLWLTYRWLSDGELTDELIDAGVPRHRAIRAVRYGRASELRRAIDTDRAGTASGEAGG
jgi:cytochrome c oxidase assembly factor CtaG